MVVVAYGSARVSRRVAGERYREFYEAELRRHFGPEVHVRRGLYRELLARVMDYAASVGDRHADAAT